MASNLNAQGDQRFSEFIVFQAQNAGLFLGKIPDPRSGQPMINLRAAQSVIDCLEMLKVKTQGNLTAAEAKLLEKALRNIKRLYAAVANGNDSK